MAPLLCVTSGSEDFRSVVGGPGRPTPDPLELFEPGRALAPWPANLALPNAQHQNRRVPLQHREMHDSTNSEGNLYPARKLHDNVNIEGIHRCVEKPLVLTCTSEAPFAIQH